MEDDYMGDIEALEFINKFLYHGNLTFALAVAKKALEKQIPKKPIAHKETNRANCPICGATVRGIKKPFGDWCSKCGQALDWSE